MNVLQEIEQALLNIKISISNRHIETKAARKMRFLEGRELPQLNIL